MHFYCTPSKLKDASGKHSQCFIKLPDMATSAGAVAQRSNPELLLPYFAFIASDGIANIAHCQINKPGFAFETMEKRLKAEMYHNDGEGRAAWDSQCTDFQAGRFFMPVRTLAESLRSDC